MHNHWLLYIITSFSTLLLILQIPKDIIIQPHTGPAETAKEWVRNLHFCLYFGQLLTDFQKFFFLLKPCLNCYHLKEWGCAIKQPAYPVPPTLLYRPFLF